MSQLKRYRLYDIYYKGGKSGPAEITIDLDGPDQGGSADVEFDHLNSKAAKAIKEATGLEVDTCKVDIVYI